MALTDLTGGRPRKWLRSVVPRPVVEAWHGWLRWRIRRRDAKVFRRTGGRIVAGPFAGLALIHVTDRISLSAKLLGTYELEVSAFVRDIATREYDLVVNAGAGEGYYSVGLLSRMPHARAVAFEAVPCRRQWIENLARLNDVHDRLTIAGVCTASELQSVLAGSQRPVVICDIEGGEMEVLDPVRAPSLVGADLLVEPHDFVHPGVSSLILERFRPSHDIAAVWSLSDASAASTWGVRPGRSGGSSKNHAAASA